MGAQESKLGSPQVWKSSGPSGISQDLVDSLQGSSETDASRSRLTEIQIQNRVSQELKKLQKQESDALKAAHEKIASKASDQDKPSANNGKDRGNKPADGTAATSFSLGKDIEALRKKLEDKKKVRELPESLDGARNEVVRCLRENDRRPLDCWQEVENFKLEVKKLEKGWIDKVTS